MSNRGRLALLGSGALVTWGALACSTPSFFTELDRGTGGSDDGGASAGENTGAMGGGGTGGMSGANFGGAASSSSGGAGGAGTGSGGTTSGGSESGGMASRGGSGGLENVTGGSGGKATGGSAGSDESTQVELSLEGDEDDAVWIGETDERLHYSKSDRYLEVGADFEMARSGFRFFLPLPEHSTVESARLRLTRRTGDASPDESMLVQVFDSATVAAFDDAHAHRPEEHDRRGLYPIAVFGFAVGEEDETIESPELASLVQHVVDRSDYVEGGALGFVLTADELDGWVQFADRAEGAGDSAKLVIRYQAP